MFLAGVYCDKADLPNATAPGYRVRHLPEPREYIKLTSGYEKSFNFSHKIVTSS